MKHSKIIQTKIIEVNRIENQGDDAYRKIITNLFTSETDTLEIMKWKEIYEYMEKTLDACEDVANIIEGIVQKMFNIALIAVIVLALIFDFINGFHDTANSIATVVLTRALSQGLPS